jgi:hypothetical protein
MERDNALPNVKHQRAKKEPVSFLHELDRLRYSTYHELDGLMA